MIDPNRVPEVHSAELLARYVLFSKHLRADATIKADAFVPHPYTELSVTRHIQASEDELWAVGRDVAAAQGKKLYGRGDVSASDCERVNLRAQAAPIVGNPNHANVVGWPASKPEQKTKAQQISAAAIFRPPPSLPAE